jgi:glycosyltransferase involved in cell wall biosynthesis
MKALRVLEVAKSTAGVAEYVRWLVQGLDRSLFDLSVVCLSEGGESFARELTQVYGVRATSLAMNRYQIDLLSDGKVALALARLLRREHFDLVHAHASKPGFLTRLAALGLDVPVIYSPHCFSFHPGAGRLKARVLALVERLAARLRTNRILVVAESEIELAQKYGVGRLEQFTAINSGIDPAPFQAAAGHPAADRAAQRHSLGLEDAAFVVGSVGRLSVQKAPLDFIRAAALLGQKYPAVHFIWFGDGPLLAEAQALCQVSGLGGRVHFAGQRQDIPACLAALDCFVLSSRWEGFPLVILEAMAAGKPVVATNIPGTSDAVQDGVDGLLAPPGDAAGMAAAIERVLLDAGLAARLAAAGLRKVQERFTRQNMLRAVTQVYLETAQRGLA